MTDHEMVIAGLLCFLVLFAVVSVLGCRAAYTNGVTDGYGYSREPNCPGYAGAGEYLQRYMAHRWPELAPKPKGKPIPPQGGTGVVRAAYSCDLCPCGECRAARRVDRICDRCED